MNEEKRQNFYIVTSIPYANAAPHVGHILDPLIADVIARHRRLKGYDVRLLVGTDEHGAKIVRTAEAQGITPRDLVDENSERFRKMHQAVGIAADDFIRTSDKQRHWPGAQKLWRALEAADDIYWKKYRGLYCVGHEAFITEKDLVGGVCADHQKAPEAVEEENLFFRLSKYAERIEEAIGSGRLLILPESRRHEAVAFIREGLEDVSVSRPRKELAWGVPVPEDPTQTIYVWLEALTSYLSSIGYGDDDPESQTSFAKWWPADVQVIGKDNLRFHAIIWPGLLLSAGLELPRMIFVHGFITVEGQKISKTVGNVIPPDEVVGKYGIDPVRYYFLRDFPSYEDGDFSYKKFEERYNGDLANGLGNLLARVATLGEKVSPIKLDFKNDIEKEIDAASNSARAAYEKHIDEFRLNEALGDIWQIIGVADRYINEQKPWATDNQDELRRIIANACYLIGAITDLLEPFLPETAAKIRTQISFTDSTIGVKKAENLFQRLS